MSKGPSSSWYDLPSVHFSMCHVRYHGVLAPNAASRDRIVPGPREVLAKGCAHTEQSPASDRSTATPGLACLYGFPCRCLS